MPLPLHQNCYFQVGDRFILSNSYPFLEMRDQIIAIKGGYLILLFI